jgi:hypothetical protein
MSSVHKSFIFLGGHFHNEMIHKIPIKYNKGSGDYQPPTFWSVQHQDDNASINEVEAVVGASPIETYARNRIAIDVNLNKFIYVYLPKSISAKEAEALCNDYFHFFRKSVKEKGILHDDYIFTLLEKTNQPIGE